MRIKKYAILFDLPSGPLAALATELKRLEFRVALVPQENAADGFVKRFPKLGLVVVNAIGKPERRTLAENARKAHPNLPVVVLDEGGCEVQTAGRSWRQEGSFSAKELEQHVSEALREHSYPEKVLAALSFSIEEALAGFGSPMAAGQAYLRATNGMPSEMTALLPFSGTRVSGYLAVGANLDTARALHATLFPKAQAPAEDDLTDLLGEICNRAIGRFHEYFENRCITFSFGVSLYLTGRSELRAAQEHPALVLEFEGPQGSVLVELFLDGLIPAHGESTAPEPQSAAGEFVLL